MANKPKSLKGNLRGDIAKLKEIPLPPSIKDALIDYGKAIGIKQPKQKENVK